MANVARARVGDLVKCNKAGFIFYGEVIGAPYRVSARVYELPVRAVGGGYWLRDVTPGPSPQLSTIQRVRGSAVETLYRQLKS